MRRDLGLMRKRKAFRNVLANLHGEDITSEEFDRRVAADVERMRANASARGRPNAEKIIAMGNVLKGIVPGEKLDPDEFNRRIAADLERTRA